MQARNVLYKAVSIVFISPYNAFSYYLQYDLPVIFLNCTTMCSYANTKAESVGKCQAIVCMNIKGKIDAVLNFSLN